MKASNGRTLVPLRFVSENLGAGVEWLAATRQVVISSGDQKIVLTLGSDAAVVNGQIRELDCPAELAGNSTCVPLRFVSENLGASVAYASASRQITITKG